MTSVEKRRSGRKSGGHRKHSDGGYSDTSSAGSFLDETDREVSNLTDRAFRSLCIGDEAVYNDSDLGASSPCTQRDRQLAFNQSGQDRDREREELKRAAHESFSLRMQQYEQDWIHGGMYGAEIQRDPQWEDYGERTHGRYSATFQHSFVETSQHEESLRGEQMAFLSNGATEVSSQPRRSRSRVSSLIRAFNSEGQRDGAGMDNKLRDRNDDTSWDKSALMSIQRELSEFSSSYQENFNSGHYPSAGPFASRNFYSSGEAAHMNAGSSFMRSSHSKHSMMAQINSNSNFFIHSEFSPFKIWRDHNRFPFQRGEVSGFMHYPDFPRWYETPMYKELSVEAQPHGPYQFQERGIRQPRNNVVPATHPRSTSTSTMLQKASSVEKRCDSEFGGHYAHRKRTQSLGNNRLTSQRPSTATPTIDMSRRVQDTISSVRALQQKIKMMTEQNITTGMTETHQGVLHKNDNLVSYGNSAQTLVPDVVRSNKSTTPFNISQLLTPSFNAHQEAETSEVQQHEASPQLVEHAPVRAESRGATPDTRMSSYKSRATSLLFNLKDNRKRVKSTYSPTKFKGLETADKNKQPFIQEPRDTVIDIPDFPETGGQYPQAEESSWTNAVSHQYLNQYYGSGLLSGAANPEPAMSHTGPYSEYSLSDYQTAPIQGQMVHPSGFTGFIPENYTDNQLANGQNLYEDFSSFTPYKQSMPDNVETLGGDMYRLHPPYTTTEMSRQNREFLTRKENTEQRFNETVGWEFPQVERYQQLNDNNYDYSNVSSQDTWRQTNSQEVKNHSFNAARSPWKQEITHVMEKDQQPQAYQRPAMTQEELYLPNTMQISANGPGTSNENNELLNPYISNQLAQNSPFSNNSEENLAFYRLQPPEEFTDKYDHEKQSINNEEMEIKDGFISQALNKNDQDQRTQQTLFANRDKTPLIQEPGQGKQYMAVQNGYQTENQQPIEVKPEFEDLMKSNANPDMSFDLPVENHARDRKLDQAVAESIKSRHAQAELPKAQPWTHEQQPKVETTKLYLAGEAGSEKVKAEEAFTQLSEHKKVDQAETKRVKEDKKNDGLREAETTVQKVKKERINIPEEAGAKHLKEERYAQVNVQVEEEKVTEKRTKTNTVQAAQTEIKELQTDQANKERIETEKLKEEKLRAEQAERERLEAEQTRLEKVKEEQAEAERRKAEQAELQRMKKKAVATQEKTAAETVKVQVGQGNEVKVAAHITKADEVGKEDEAHLKQTKIDQATAELKKDSLPEIKAKPAPKLAITQQVKSEPDKVEQVKTELAKAKAELAKIKEKMKGEQKHKVKNTGLTTVNDIKKHAPVRVNPNSNECKDRDHATMMQQPSEDVLDACRQSFDQISPSVEYERLREKYGFNDTTLTSRNKQSVIGSDSSNDTSETPSHAKSEIKTDEKSLGKQSPFKSEKANTEYKEEISKSNDVSESQYIYSESSKEFKLSSGNNIPTNVDDGENNSTVTEEVKEVKKAEKSDSLIQSDVSHQKDANLGLPPERKPKQSEHNVAQGKDKHPTHHRGLSQKEKAQTKQEILTSKIKAHAEKEISAIRDGLISKSTSKQLGGIQSMNIRQRPPSQEAPRKLDSTISSTIPAKNPVDLPGVQLGQVKSLLSSAKVPVKSAATTSQKEDLPQKDPVEPIKDNLPKPSKEPSYVTGMDDGLVENQKRETLSEIKSPLSSAKVPVKSAATTSPIVDHTQKDPIEPMKDNAPKPPNEPKPPILETGSNPMETDGGLVENLKRETLSGIKSPMSSGKELFKSAVTSSQIADHSQKEPITTTEDNLPKPSKEPKLTVLEMGCYPTSTDDGSVEYQERATQSRIKSPLSSAKVPVKSAATISQIGDHSQKDPIEPMKDNLQKPPKEQSYPVATGLLENQKRETQSGLKSPTQSKEQVPKNKKGKHESNHVENSGEQLGGLQASFAVDGDHLNKDTEATHLVEVKSPKPTTTEEDNMAPTLNFAFSQRKTTEAEGSLQITGIMVTVRERNTLESNVQKHDGTKEEMNAKGEGRRNSDKENSHPNSGLETRKVREHSKGSSSLEIKERVSQSTHTPVKEAQTEASRNVMPGKVQEASTPVTSLNNETKVASIHQKSSNTVSRPQGKTQLTETLPSTVTVPDEDKRLAEIQSLSSKGTMGKETKVTTNKTPTENSIKSKTQETKPDRRQSTDTSNNIRPNDVQEGKKPTNANKADAKALVKPDIQPTVKEDMKIGLHPIQRGKTAPLQEIQKHQEILKNNQVDDGVHIDSIAIRVLPAANEVNLRKAERQSTTDPSEVDKTKVPLQAPSSIVEESPNPTNKDHLNEASSQNSEVQRVLSSVRKLSDSLRNSSQLESTNTTSQNIQEKVNSVVESKMKQTEEDYFQVHGISETNHEPQSTTHVGDMSNAISGREVPELSTNKRLSGKASKSEGTNEVFVFDQSKRVESSSVSLQDQNTKRKKDDYGASKQADSPTERQSVKHEKPEVGQSSNIRKQHLENKSSFSSGERQSQRNSHPTRESGTNEKTEVKPTPKPRASTIPEISALADYARLKVIVSEDRENPIQEFPPNKKEGFFPLIQSRHSRRPVFTADPQEPFVKEKSLPNKTEASLKVSPAEPKPLAFPITEKEHQRTGMFKLGDKDRQDRTILDAKNSDGASGARLKPAQYIKERNKSPIQTQPRNASVSQQVKPNDHTNQHEKGKELASTNEGISYLDKHSHLQQNIGRVNNTEENTNTSRKGEKKENVSAEKERSDSLKHKRPARHKDDKAKEQNRIKQLGEGHTRTEDKKRAEDLKIKHIIEESRASLAEEERRAAQREEERRVREREAIAQKIKERREKLRETEKQAEKERQEKEKAKQKEEEIKAKQKEEEKRVKEIEMRKLREAEERLKESEEKRRAKQLREERAAQEEQLRRTSQEEQQRRVAEQERSRAAQEEEQRRAAQEEQQKKAAEEEQRRRVAEEERRRAAQEEQQRRTAQEEQQRRAAQEEQQRRAAQEERRRAAQEEQLRRAAEEERRRTAQEEQQKIAAQEEEQKRAAQEEQQRRAAQEEQQRRAAEEEQRRAAEEERRRAAQEEQRRAAQEEKQRRAAQEEQKRRAAEQERQRRAAQEEHQRRAAEQEKQRRAAQEEHQRRAAQEEKQRRAAQEEQQRRAAEQENERRAAQEEQQKRAAEQEKQRRAAQEEQEIRAAQEEQQRRAAQEEQQRRAALIEERRRAKQIKEMILSDIEEEKQRNQRELEKRAQIAEKERIKEQRKFQQHIEEQSRGQPKKEETVRVLSQNEERDRDKAVQKMEALQYYAITSTDSERKPKERQLSPPVPPKQRNKPSELESSQEESHTRSYRPHAPASPAPSLPRSNTSSPAPGVKPLMFRVKDNTFRGSSFTKSVKPRFHKNFGEDFRVGSPMDRGSERADEEQETMRRGAGTPVHPDMGSNRLAAIREISTPQLASSTMDYSAPLTQHRPYSRRSIALDEDDSRSIISNMSEDVESFATSAADLSEIRSLYYDDRPESACSFSSDVSRSLGKPPVVPPKSEKALRRAKRLTSRRITKEMSKAAADSSTGVEKPLQDVSSNPPTSSTEVRSSNRHAVASPHFSPPVSLAHAPTLGSSLSSFHTEHQSSHSSFHATPHATGPISLQVASPHATAPVSLPVVSTHATGPASHSVAPKTVAHVPSSPTLHPANHPAPVTQYHVESGYPQAYPLTQRKVLQDLGSGQYFVVDVPVQVKTKTFFDPETGKYVQLNVRESSQSTTRPQQKTQQAYLQPQLHNQMQVKSQQQPLSQASPSGKPVVLYDGYPYPQGYQTANSNSLPQHRSSAPVTPHQDEQPVRPPQTYGYPAPESGSEGHRYSPEKTPYMDTVNDSGKTYNAVYNTHGPYESFPECDTNSQLAGSSVCENDSSAPSRCQPRDIITISELEDFMEVSDW